MGERAFIENQSELGKRRLITHNDIISAVIVSFVARKLLIVPFLKGNLPENVFFE
jgi:hypothetical protein